MGTVALTTALEVAVPLHIEEVSMLTDAERIEQARECADEVAAHGDALQYGGRRGAAAQAFNKLARGLAIAAHAPGGVDFAGAHWCVDTHEDCPRRRRS